MVAEITEYKNHPVIILKEKEDDQYWALSFGTRKAGLIVDNFEAIKKFVKENSD